MSVDSLTSVVRFNAGARDLMHVLLALLAPCLFSVSACTRATPHDPTAQKPASIDFSEPYRAGAWRLAPYELSHVVLTVSHILIEAHEPPDAGATFSGRSRAQALKRALEVARLAHQAPKRFPELARQYSDDPNTREQGGNLGAQGAGLFPPPFLDALSAMSVGSTSRVVETSMGFHVLRLEPTPPAHELSARRIVLGYAGGRPFPLRPGRSLSRSREQAAALAARLTAEAKAHPERFGELVAEHSDHTDAFRGGDMGTWSSLAGMANDPVHAPIERLAIGQVSEPIADEAFYIFMRSEVTARAKLAAIYLQGIDARRVRDEKLPLELPSELEPLLQGDTREFETLLPKYGGGALEQWAQGSAEANVEQLVLSLQIGEIGRTPVELAPGLYRFYKRVAPDPSASAEVFRTELPQPQHPDIDRLVATAPEGAAVATFIAALRSSLGPELGLELDGAQTEKLRQTLDTLERSMRSTSADQRLAALDDARRQLREALGGRKFAALQANMRGAVARKLLPARVP